MIGENFDNSTEDSKSFGISDSGCGSMVSSDEDNNWMMQANEVDANSLSACCPAWIVSKILIG